MKSVVDRHFDVVLIRCLDSKDNQKLKIRRYIVQSSGKHSSINIRTCLELTIYSSGAIFILFCGYYLLFYIYIFLSSCLFKYLFLQANKFKFIRCYEPPQVIPFSEFCLIILVPISINIWIILELTIFNSGAIFWFM